MRKIFYLFSLTCYFGLVVLLAAGSEKFWVAHAQAFPSTDVAITAGVNYSFTVDVTKTMAVPPCSKAAGCVATIEVCNTKLGLPTPVCIELNGTANFGVTPLSWALVETTGTAAPVKYQVAKLQIGIPSAEANVTP